MVQATAPSIQAVVGRNFLLKITDGLSPSQYTTVAGCRATDMTINSGTVDLTNKSSNGWQEILPAAGIRSVDITASGVLDATAGSEAITILKTALNGGTPLICKIVSDAGDSFTGTWMLKSYKRTGNHNDAEMFDFSLSSHGVIQYHGR